jgi:hypothetical protein
MTITLNLPEDVARQLVARGEDPARAALEALAAEGYRSNTLTEEQVRRILGFETRGQVHAFLKKHDIHLAYSTEDLKEDLEKSLDSRE